MLNKLCTTEAESSVNTCDLTRQLQHSLHLSRLLSE